MRRCCVSLHACDCDVTSRCSPCVRGVRSHGRRRSVPAPKPPRAGTLSARGPPFQIEAARSGGTPVCPEVPPAGAGGDHMHHTSTLASLECTSAPPGVDRWAPCCMLRLGAKCGRVTPSTDGCRGRLLPPRRAFHRRLCRHRSRLKHARPSKCAGAGTADLPLTTRGGLYVDTPHTRSLRLPPLLQRPHLHTLGTEAPAP